MGKDRRWNRQDKIEALRDAAEAVIVDPELAQLFEFAHIAIKATRPDAGLVWSEVMMALHSACRSDLKECRECPHCPTLDMLEDRMRNHARVAEWETEWNIVDELSVHESIHCHPCKQWERRKCAHKWEPHVGGAHPNAFVVMWCPKCGKEIRL